VADVVSTPNFERAAKRERLTEAERDELVLFLASMPGAGDLIQGSGGARKVRLAKEGRGKSGGYRVVTYFGGGGLPVYLITMYSKSSQTDLSPADKKAIKSLCKTLAERNKTLRG
jgi:hypothetical protein